MSTTVMWILFAISSLIFAGSVTLLILQRRAMKKQERGLPEDNSGALADPVIDQSVFDAPDDDMKIAPARASNGQGEGEELSPQGILRQAGLLSQSAVPRQPTEPAQQEKAPSEDGKSEFDRQQTSSLRPVSLPQRDVVILTQQGEEYVKNVFPGGADITVGRAPGNSLVLTDPSVSGRHCVFQFTEQGLVLEDLNSSNGTLLGNVRIREPALIEAGDRIWVGMTGLFIQSL